MTRQIRGAEREKFKADLAKRYAEGASIYDLCEQTGRSYGAIRDLLMQAGVVFRKPGGIGGGAR